MRVDGGLFMKVVINRCFGGFGLSDTAYEKLIQYGVPVRKYIEQTRNPVTHLYEPEPANDGEVIFDRELTLPGEDSFGNSYKPNGVFGRYWETWVDQQRTHPLLIRVVEELGASANGRWASLAIVEIPDSTDYTIEEYDGNEHIAEVHKTWR